MATVAKAKKRQARKRRVRRDMLDKTATAIDAVVGKLRSEAECLPDRGRMIDGARMPERALSLLNRFIGKLHAAKHAD
jgi:hypothetical protein